jgi:hypothetical protein
MATLLMQQKKTKRQSILNHQWDLIDSKPP